MEIPALQYHRPTTLQQACELGSMLGAEARYLAGGTDLLIDLKQRRLQVEHLVSLQSVDDLHVISVSDTGLQIGALATLSQVAESPLVQRHAPGLVEAIETMAALQIRNRATLGGNFCAAVPCADTPPACMVYRGELRIVSSSAERRVAAEDFFLLPRRSVLGSGEVLAQIRLPLHLPGRGAAYARFSRRRSMSLAVAAVAACVELRGGVIQTARLAMTSVAPTPLLAQHAASLLLGAEPSDDALLRASRAAAAEARPISDLRGSAEYRRDLVEVLALRALRSAVERARVDQPSSAVGARSEHHGS